MPSLPSISSKSLKSLRDSPGKLWDLFNDLVLMPKVNHKKLETQFDAVKQQFPTPVFWLLGKAQSGKTSVIRALTQDDRAVIGMGVRPCTKTSFIYDFPNSNNPFLKFLDTRGLGEVDYDPTEDMEQFEQQSHLLIVVLKAMDPAQQSVLEPVKRIMKDHPDWPVLVVQSTLHEGYPRQQTVHHDPFPYNDELRSEEIPEELRRSLMHQREWFKGLNVTFVPIDFTLPEDGYTPVFYGVDALWQAIESILPLGLRSMVNGTKELRQGFRDIFLKSAHPHIISYALIAGSAGLIPIPFASIPLTVMINAKMFQTIASIYNQELTPRHMAEISGVLGITTLTQLGQRELVKFVPVYGSAAASISGAASTYALGKTYCYYFSHIAKGDLPSKELFQKLYAEQLKEGRQVLKSFFHNFKSKSDS